MLTKQLKVAMLPMPIVWGDKRTNLDTLAAEVEKLHHETDLLILPETFSTGFPSGLAKEDVRPMAERNTGVTIDFIKALAKKYNVAICGSFIADTGGLICNRAFFIEPNGEETFADKKHLFTMAGEHKVFAPGADRLSIRYRGWNIAMVICYDIRFPVWCRNRECEYDLLIAVANWPTVRADAWNKLIPARAIENAAYVCAVNCKGTDTGGFEYGGDTHAYDFKGKEIGVTVESSDTIYALLDHEKLARFREKFPAWRDADHFSLTE